MQGAGDSYYIHARTRARENLAAKIRQNRELTKFSKIYFFQKSILRPFLGSLTDFLLFYNPSDHKAKARSKHARRIDEMRHLTPILLLFGKCKTKPTQVTISEFSIAIKQKSSGQCFNSIELLFTYRAGHNIITMIVHTKEINTSCELQVNLLKNDVSAKSRS